MSHLKRSETPLAIVVALSLLSAVFISVSLEQSVDWVGFVPGIAPGVMLLGLGLYLRICDQRTRMADFFVATGIYILFGAFMAITIFCFFPIFNPTIDHHLFGFDAYLGYDWQAAVAWTAQFPSLGKLMGLTYHSSLWQILAALAFFAWAQRHDRMHDYLLAGFIALTLTLVFWCHFPSFGPAAYLDVPAEQTQAIGLIVNPAYGATLMDYARNGIEVIGPATIIGSIAFPSFHTVMLCLTLWYARGTTAFLPLVLVNALMVPAILIHGGHHVIDVIGGILMSALSVFLTTQIMLVNLHKNRPLAAFPWARSFWDQS